MNGSRPSKKAKEIRNRGDNENPGPLRLEAISFSLCLDKDFNTAPLVQEVSYSYPCVSYKNK